MKKIKVLAVLAALFFIAAHAQETGMENWKQDPASAQTQEQTWRGYLVDNQTAKAFVKDPDRASQNVAAYSKATALQYGFTAGYMLYSDGQWLKLDALSTMKAHDVVRNSIRQNGIFVEISGTVNGDVITISSIKEIPSEEEEKQPQLN